MISYTSITRHNALSFSDYLKLPGLSHSFLKYNKSGVIPYKEATEKMLIGSMVDRMLTEPDKVNASDPLFSMCREFAIKIKSTHPWIIRLPAQLSFSAMAEHNRLSMRVCGRLDWLLERHAVIDLKVTGARNDKEFAILIEHMGYKNQLWNYAKMAQVSAIYILPFSSTSMKCLSLVKLEVADRNDFWENAIMQHGSI